MQKFLSRALNLQHLAGQESSNSTAGIWRPRVNEFRMHKPIRCRRQQRGLLEQVTLKKPLTQF